MVANINSALPGSSGYYNVNFLGSGRDIIDIGNGTYGLELDFASPLTGTGPIIPTDTFQYSTYGSTPNSFVIIASGSISLDVALDIDGLPFDANGVQYDKNNVGGLVVMSSDNNNAPRAEITIRSPYNVVLTENNNKVSIFTAATGGTPIAFDGVHNVFASTGLPINLYVQGSSYSDTMRDVELDAQTFGHTGSTGTLFWADPASDTTCVVLTSLPARAIQPHPRDLAGERVGRARRESPRVRAGL